MDNHSPHMMLWLISSSRCVRSESCNLVKCLVSYFPIICITLHILSPYHRLRQIKEVVRNRDDPTVLYSYFWLVRRESVPGKRCSLCGIGTLTDGEIGMGFW